MNKASTYTIISQRDRVNIRAMINVETADIYVNIYVSATTCCEWLQDIWCIKYKSSLSKYSSPLSAVYMYYLLTSVSVSTVTTV